MAQVYRTLTALFMILVLAFTTRAEEESHETLAPVKEGDVEQYEYGTVNYGKVYYGKRYTGKVHVDSTNMFIVEHHLTPLFLPDPKTAIRTEKNPFENNFNMRLYWSILTKMCATIEDPSNTETPSD